MRSADWKTKREVTRHYDELATVYDSLYADEQTQKAKLALSATHVEDSDLVLDVGCGTGLLFDHTGDHVDLYVGVDMSPGLLRAAQNRSKRLGSRFRVCLVRTDADYLPFKDEAFSKVFALTLLQNMPDPSAALQEMVRVAENDSRIVVTGLKKAFTEDGFSSLLTEAGIEFSRERPAEPTQDYIAVCRRSRMAKDK